jgi:predicted permease
MTSKRDRELDEEIRSHLDMSMRDRMERGEAREQAEASARREFGNVALVKEVTRDVSGWAWLERLFQDLPHAARLLQRSPAFTFVAILSLSLGVGANTAIFQVINAVGLRALPVHDPDRLVHIRIADTTGARGSFNSRFASVTNPIWEELRRTQQAFSSVMAWGDATFNLGSGGLARPARGLWVSGSFFDTLGVRAAAGRLFNEADDRAGCAPRAVISHGFWQTELGGRQAVGSTLSLDGHAVEIVGVSAPAFTGVVVGRSFDVALPICSQPLLSDGKGMLNAGTDWWLVPMGRLKQGWTVEQASAHLAAISPGVFRATLPPTYPAVSVNHYLGFTLQAVPGGAGVSGLREDYSLPLWLLLATAAVVLVIACVNLANLMLARASAREREFAIRLGLGASRSRITRQLLVESLLLAGIGAACGSFLARVLSRSLVSFLDTDRGTIALDLATDWRVLAFTVTAAILTCVLFGLAPALRATRVSPSVVIRSLGRGLTATRERFALRRALVTLQIALSLLLLAVALLFTRTLTNLLAVDPGFAQDGVIVMTVDLRRLKVPIPQRHALRAEILSSVRGTAGVQSAAEVSIVPVSGSSWSNNVWMDGRDAAVPVNALFNRVSSGYFATLGIPLVAGRDFSEADAVNSPPVAIVNETFVRTVAQGVNPIGHRVRREATPYQPEEAYEIVGVVRDAKYIDLRQEPLPVVFFAARQASEPGEYVRLMVRSTVLPSASTGALTAAIGELSPQAVVSFDILKEKVRETVVRERLMATLSSFFGIVAALLAMVGLYGVIAYTVARRTNEIGVRMALGAGRQDVLRMILAEAFVLTGIGIVTGLALALAGGSAASMLLFGLKAHDPATLAAAGAMLAVIAFAASYLPARAAARIDPMAALRID